MSGGSGTWDELSSQHERLIQRSESGRGPAVPVMVPSQWAELGSQSERLADMSDPLVRLASSSHHSPPGMRLVATRAA